MFQQIIVDPIRSRCTRLSLHDWSPQISQLEGLVVDFNVAWGEIYFHCLFLLLYSLECSTVMHSVESPSMVDPQWNMWYWGSKWNLHTVCWTAVGCEWGTTSVYFGITYVCFIPSRLPVFAVEPQYLLQYFFYFCQKYHLTYTYKMFKKFHVGLKFEWDL